MRSTLVAATLVTAVLASVSFARTSSRNDKSLTLITATRLAADQKTEKSSPTVDEILDNYVRAIGGRTAIGKIKTFVAKGSFESGKGLTKITIYNKYPDKMLTVIDWPGGFARKYGCDGRIAWGENELHRVVELSGLQLKAALRECASSQSIRMRELFQKIEFRGTATVNGRKAYVLEAAAEDGLITDKYYDVDSGLVIQEDVQAYLENYDKFVSKRTILKYKEIEGVKMPCAIYEESPTGHMTLNVEEFQVNAPIDDSVFARPANTPAKIMNDGHTT